MSTTVRLGEHFRRLFDFQGREDRASFWPYAALVYGMMTVATMVAVGLLMQQMTFSSDMAPMGLDMTSFVDGILVACAAGILLYAAAVVRRLHDAGLSGLWGLMPLPFLIFSMVQMRSIFTSFGSERFATDGFTLIFVSNILYTVTILALIVLLCRRSDPGPNCFDRTAE